jgi:hypothetical protein
LSIGPARYLQRCGLINARNGYVSPLLLTTYPPQRDFRFTLDGTTYYGRTNLGLKAAIAGALKAPRP